MSGGRRGGGRPEPAIQGLVRVLRRGRAGDAVAMTRSTSVSPWRACHGVRGVALPRRDVGLDMPDTQSTAIRRAGAPPAGDRPSLRAGAVLRDRQQHAPPTSANSLRSWRSSTPRLAAAPLGTLERPRRNVGGVQRGHRSPSRRHLGAGRRRAAGRREPHALDSVRSATPVERGAGRRTRRTLLVEVTAYRSPP